MVVFVTRVGHTDPRDAPKKTQAWAAGQSRDTSVNLLPGVGRSKQMVTWLGFRWVTIHPHIQQRLKKPSDVLPSS